METVIFHDLSEIGTKGRQGRQQEKNSFRLYVNIKSDGGFGTHTIGFSPDCDFYKSGFSFMNLAENSLTGEKFINFSKTKGAELRLLNKSNKKTSSPIGTAKNLVVRYVADFLKVDWKKGVRATVIFSDNLSSSNEAKTYKILEIKV